MACLRKVRPKWGDFSQWFHIFIASDCNEYAEHAPLTIDLREHYFTAHSTVCRAITGKSNLYLSLTYFFFSYATPFPIWGCLVLEWQNSWQTREMFQLLLGQIWDEFNCHGPLLESSIVNAMLNSPAHILTGIIWLFQTLSRQLALPMHGGSVVEIQSSIQNWKLPNMSRKLRVCGANLPGVSAVQSHWNEPSKESWVFCSVKFKMEVFSPITCYVKVLSKQWMALHGTSPWDLSTSH